MTLKIYQKFVNLQVNIEITEQARGTKNIFLSCEIKYHTNTKILISDFLLKILGDVSWQMRSQNGSRILLDTEKSQEIMISRSQLEENKIIRVYATIQAFYKDSGKELISINEQIEAFWNVEFSPPKIQGYLEPSLKIITIKDSLFFSIADIEIDNAESVIDGSTALVYNIYTEDGLVNIG